MNAKLYKTEKENYVLVDPTKGTYDDGYTLGTSRESQFNKLSIKNCEAIERGYDLDELLDNITPNNGTTGNISERIGFVKGFQKSLELMGDNKFSEADIKEAYLSGVDDAMDIKYDPNATIDDEKYLKSLQQTEWDVEIEMEWIQSTFILGNPHQIPKLDADGCLILKRI